jgi:SAM-dependent methyltransferase
MIELDPPGTLCQNQAVLELVRALRARTFCEVGVGTGSLSLALCRIGLRGVGIELSSPAAAVARQRLPGDFHLIEGDFLSMPPPDEEFDVALSMMVMEHIEDDAAFARRLASLVGPGGTVILGVPARRDRWGVEDEAAGHLRRYERGDLGRVMAAGGLHDVVIRSVSVPAANITFHLSNLLVRSAWSRRQSLSQQERTELSGLHDVPFKTMFPVAFKLVLNPVAMYPLFVLQRAFYGTDWGLTFVASGKRPA